MSFFDKAKQAANQAVAKTKEGVEDVQQKHQLSQAYGELGKTAFELIEAGEISHPKFEVTEMKIGVVGLGTMGAGIAQLAVEAGLETVGREVTDELGEKARGRIDHFLTRKVEKGQIESYDIGLLSKTTDVADFADCDVVIEAIVEELGPKQELFAALEQVCRPDAVLATNTSALSVTEIAGAVSTPERLG